MAVVSLDQQRLVFDIHGNAILPSRLALHTRLDHQDLFQASCERHDDGLPVIDPNACAGFHDGLLMAKVKLA